MDSFYDQPRSAPVPTSINQIISSRVPEVSIIIQPDVNSSKQNKLLPVENKISYNVWKSQNQNRLDKTPKARCNKENVISSNKCENSFQNVSKALSRKHVRFNSPQVQKPVLELSDKTSISGSGKGIESNEQEYNHHNNEKSKTAFNKPFEQIYMANIPNRQLDVSIAEPSYYPGTKTKTENSEIRNCDKLTNRLFFNKVDDSYSVFRNSEETCGSRNICKSNFQNLQKPSYRPLREFNHQLQPTNNNKQEDYNDPTVKDLLNVVQQQNEQILLLQKQVSLLLESQSNPKQVEMPAIKEMPPPLHDSIRNKEDKPQYDRYHNPKGTLSKFAIDVMTSFEVSIRSPNFPHNNLINECSKAPKIHEITDTEINEFNKENVNSNNVYRNVKKGCNEEDEVKQSTDLSLILDKPIEIVERCPSPVNSIHVDMKDFSSDSDDDSIGSSTDIGWTVYNNIMGQVNNLLKKSNAKSKDIGCSSNSNIMSGKTFKKVKRATMQHLKSIGVNLPVMAKPDTSQRSDETVNGSEYTPTEVSFAVKQLLMKYLPDDQLTKITHMPPKEIPKENIRCNTENLIKRRPEFSFATVQYMKKYNLLTSDTVHQQEPQQAPKHTEVHKILDVTALKQQPKLL